MAGADFDAAQLDVVVRVANQTELEVRHLLPAVHPAVAAQLGLTPTPDVLELNGLEARPG